MRGLFFTVLFFFFSGTLALAGIYIYSNEQLPFWAFEKNINGLNDLSQSKKIEAEENIFFKVSVEDPLEANNLDNVSSRNISKLVIEGQDDKITVINPEDETQSSEQKLSEVSDKFLFNPLSKDLWADIAMNRDYEITEATDEWIFQINDEKSKQIFLNYFIPVDQTFSENLISELSSTNIEGLSFGAVPTEFEGDAEVEVTIDKNDYSINSVRLVVNGAYTIAIQISITDKVLENLPEEQKRLNGSLIQVSFDEIESTYTFNLYERLPEYNLPSNPIHFWAEQVL